MNTEYKKGIFLALSAYILWGILPIYWQFVDAIGAFEILAFRIIFSYSRLDKNNAMHFNEI